jgi:fibro-slime domain-containing protein
VDEPSQSTLTVPILYRDMLYAGTTVPGLGHPDFQSFGSGVVTGLVKSTLGTDSEPVWNSNGSTPALTGAIDFCWWFHETGCNGTGNNPFDKLVYLDQFSAPTTLTLTQSAGTYSFASTQFYPLDDLGWNAGPNPQTDLDCSATGGPHNFSFTSELHYPFTYSAAAAPTFAFTGDDDAWLFVGGHLAIDQGGVHGPTSGSITLDAATAATLGLVDGGVYTLDFFKAERHTCSSQYTITLSGFTHGVSACTPGP